LRKSRSHCLISNSSHSKRFYTGTLVYPRYIVEQLNILGVSHMHRKEFEQSNSALIKALTICEYHTFSQKEKPWSLNLIVRTLSSLCQLSQSQQNNVDSLKYAIQINEINLKAYENKTIPHQSYLSGLCILAVLQFDLGNFDAAEKEFLRVIEIDKTANNRWKENISKPTAQSLYYLGKIERDRNNLERARLLLEYSWEIYREVVGIMNIHIYNVVLELAKVYQSTGDHFKARNLLEFCGQGFESFVYDEKKAAETAALWGESAEVLGLKNVRTVGPQSKRHGLNLYPRGESPEEKQAKRENQRLKKKHLNVWKKSHSISKFESNIKDEDYE